MSIGERIRQARKDRGYTQAELAAAVGITRGACGQWERGYTTPSVDHLVRIAVTLTIRFEWLATGRGDREYDPSVRDLPPVPYGSSIQPRITPEQRRLMAAFSRLSSRGQRRLIAFLDVL